MRTVLSTLLLALALGAARGSAAEIALQALDMTAPPAGELRSVQVLPEAISEVELQHVALAGPVTQIEALQAHTDAIFLFIQGTGLLHAQGRTHVIAEESIAFAPASSILRIEAQPGSALHYLRVNKASSVDDRENRSAFPAGHRSRAYFRALREGEPYTEEIKSSKAVSRTVLPQDYVPRVAMGTVESTGPDQVGASEHPGLERLFLGLAGNDAVLHAGEETVPLPAFSVVHIPLGSRHWVETGPGKRMHYLWMAFFLTKDGQEWLRTHQPVETGP